MLQDMEDLAQGGTREGRYGNERHGTNLNMFTDPIVSPPMTLPLNMAIVISSTVLPSFRQKAMAQADMTPPIFLAAEPARVPDAAYVTHPPRHANLKHPPARNASRKLLNPPCPQHPWPGLCTRRAATGAVAPAELKK